jgi:hypothetical protein
MRIQTHLFNPTYIKAPEKNTNSNEDQGSHRQTPTTAAFDPTPAAAVKEEPMATTDLEEPHCLQGLKKPQETPDIEARMMMTR